MYVEYGAIAAFMTKKIEDDQNKLLGQWLADINSLKKMVASMQVEITNMQAAGVSEGRIMLRRDMIEQYKTTISKLQALVQANDI